MRSSACQVEVGGKPTSDGGPARRAGWTLLRTFIAALTIGLVMAAPVSAAPASGFVVEQDVSTPPVSAAAVSDGPGSETITWAVNPSDEQGPDGRAWMELTVDPGETVTEHLAVRNLSRIDAAFALTAADGYFTDKGRFNMLTSDTPSTESGSWITIRESVDVPAGELVVVPFTISVPENATPGDHAAGVAASIRFVRGDGGGVGVESRIGFRVMTRVTGEMAPVIAIRDISADYRTSWNPLAGGVVDGQVVVANDGNVAVTVQGTMSVGGTTAELGFTDGSPTIELLPGAEQTVTAQLSGIWPIGPRSVDVVLSGTVSESTVPVPAVTGSVTIWALPWPQLIVLIGLTLLLVAWHAGRRRKRKQLRDLLDRAKAEGRAEATRSHATT